MNRWLSALTPARLVVLIALLGVFAMAARPSVDTDTWWHLRAGAWTVTHSEILTRDVFSFTRASEPWINHSWLAQVILYTLWQTWGYAGLNLFTAALSRKPTPQELAKADELWRRRGDGKAALQDLWWAVLNSNEFILNH